MQIIYIKSEATKQGGAFSQCAVEMVLYRELMGFIYTTKQDVGSDAFRQDGENQ